MAAVLGNGIGDPLVIQEQEVSRLDFQGSMSNEWVPRPAEATSRTAGRLQIQARVEVTFRVDGRHRHEVTHGHGPPGPKEGFEC